MTVEQAQELIKTVDTNGDGELQLEEFCELMATPGSLTLLPTPPSTAEERLKSFDAETAVVKKSSPTKALFKKIADRDPVLTVVKLNMQETDNAINMEFKSWPAPRKAAAIALMQDSPVIVEINAAGAGLSDPSARALAAVLGAPGCKIEILNLERNNLAEPGLLEIVRALSSNTTLRELKLTGQSSPITTAVETAL